MNDTFSNHEHARVTDLANSLAGLLHEYDSNEHELERRSISDRILALIRPSAGDTALRDSAWRILDAKMASTTAAFVEATEPFYTDQESAIRAAQKCDAVFSLRRDRSSLSESASLDLARKYELIFNEFLAANPQQPA